MPTGAFSVPAPASGIAARRWSLTHVAVVYAAVMAMVTATDGRQMLTAVAACRPGSQRTLDAPAVQDEDAAARRASTSSGDITCWTSIVAAPTTPAWRPVCETTICSDPVANGSDLP